MTISLNFLGTGCMVPTKDRNHLSVGLEYNGDIFLFDCGEGTQLQIKKMKLHLSKIKKIFISHWHGDHVLGLPGLLMTLSNTDNVENIEIYGPKNSKEYIYNLKKSMVFDARINIKVFEIEPKKDELLTIIENRNYKIVSANLNHSVPCIGYSFIEKDLINLDKEKLKKIGLENSSILARAKLGLDIEYKNKKIKNLDITYIKKGRKISFIFDTRPCKGADLIANNSNYLIIEATYLFKNHAKKAEEYDHMSAKESAIVALENNVDNLILTHFSQRYTDLDEILAEAKEIFENTTLTYDLMKLKIK